VTSRAPVHALGFAAVAASALLAAALLPLDAPPLSLFACPMKLATGWPCLFCGCTHAFHHFVRGEWLSSLGASPLGFVIVLSLSLHLLVTLLRLAGLPLRLPAFEIRPRMRWAALGLVALNWAFVAARTRGAL
jgi:hypothetical protein